MVKWSDVVGVVVVVAVAAACSSGHGTSSSPSTSAAAQAQYGCGQVSVDRWAAADNKSPDEPTLRLPQPPDWKIVRVSDPTVNNRLILRDDRLGTRLAPSVIVSISEVTAQAPNPQAVIDTERNNVNQSGATDIAATAGTVCGFQASTLTYKTDRGAPVPRAVKAIVVAPEYNGKVFDVVVTAQAGDAGDAYLPDTQTMLTGMEIKAPAAN